RAYAFTAKARNSIAGLPNSGERAKWSWILLYNGDTQRIRNGSESHCFHCLFRANCPVLFWAPFHSEKPCNFNKLQGFFFFISPDLSTFHYTPDCDLDASPPGATATWLGRGI